MFLDAKKADANTVLKTEICIIGAGAAGITLAREMARHSKNVLLIEAGEYYPQEFTQALCDEESTGVHQKPNKYLHMSRLRLFGGTTAHWGGCCRPFAEADFFEREWVRDSGWPITRRDLEPYYLKAKEVCQLTEVSTLEKPENPQVGSLQFSGESSLEVNVYNFSPPTRFGTEYRKELEDSKWVQVLLNANVVKLGLRENRSSVDSVEIRTQEGKTLKVQASSFILATGAIENARLLLSSDTPNGPGIGNDLDVVGRYYMDHPTARVGVTTLWKPRDRIKAFFDSNLKYKAMLSPTFETQKKENISNFSVDFKEDGPPPFKGPEGNPSRASLMIARGLKEQATDCFFEIHLEQAPNSNSRVTLSKKRNALGVPEAKLNWNLLDIDYLTLRKAYEIFARELGRSQLGRARVQNSGISDLEAITKHPESLGNGALIGFFHHMGTTRMSENPKKGVVDRNCKVHGVKNLYIAGSSVFPTSSVVNPTLTLVALSIRLAEHLKNQSKS